MKKEIADKWVAALRSGDYKQGKSLLRDKQDNFCCLGVLCNIHAQDNPELAATQNSPHHYFGYSSILPPKVEFWAEMKDGNGWIHSMNVSLTMLNDNGKSFDTIADIIENHWREL